jgi:hypothetical protein
MSSANDNPTGTNSVGTGSCGPTAQPEIVPGIPTYSNAPANLRCCCGRQDCALLEHNSLALEGLEKDLATAARLGQVRSASGKSFLSDFHVPGLSGANVMCGGSWVNRRGTAGLAG